MSEKATSPRVARRREAQRAKILRVAAARYAERGPESVRLDEIADEADVARGTLYSHFASKDQLVEAIVAPVLEDAVAGLRKIGRGRARDRLDGLLSLYLDLWATHPDALRLSYRLQSQPLGQTARLHETFVKGVLDTLSSACRARILRVPEPLMAARMIMRVTVPLLEICTTQPHGDRLFMECMRGLLVVDRRPGAGNNEP